MLYFWRIFILLVFVILCFAAEQSVSQTADILLQRTSNGDYLENAWSTFCDQYTGAVWDEEGRLCKCSTSAKLNFVSFGGGPIGCYKGNEDKCKYVIV